MKNSLTRIAGLALTTTLALGMISCSKENVLKPECVLVPGGTVIGADYSGINFEGVFPEGRTVTLGSFYMGKYEVTQEQYKSVMEGQKVKVGGREYALNATPSECTDSSENYKVDFGKDHSNHPVENVTWYDAVYYCNILSAKEKLKPCYTITVQAISPSGSIYAAEVTFDKTKNGYRLPTEVEWEYAARGGDPSKAEWNYTYSGADSSEGFSYRDYKNAGLDSVGWYCFNNLTGTTEKSDATDSAEGRGTHEVGKKAPNSLGIYDMSGNVMELCYDKYGSITPDTDITGATEGYRVYRGGSWFSDAYIATVSSRGFYPNEHNSFLGFRVCRNAE